MLIASVSSNTAIAPSSSVKLRRSRRLSSTRGLRQRPAASLPKEIAPRCQELDRKLGAAAGGGGGGGSGSGGGGGSARDGGGHINNYPWRCGGWARRGAGHWAGRAGGRAGGLNDGREKEGERQGRRARERKRGMRLVGTTREAREVGAEEEEEGRKR